MTESQIRNPRTGQADFRMPVSDASAVQTAAARLRGRQGAWAARGVEDRAADLLAWRERLLDRKSVV